MGCCLSRQARRSRFLVVVDAVTDLTIVWVLCIVPFVVLVVFQLAGGFWRIMGVRGWVSEWNAAVFYVWTISIEEMFEGLN